MPILVKRLPNLSEYNPGFRWYPSDLKAVTVGLFELTGSASNEEIPDSFVNLVRYYHSEALRLVKAGAYPRAQELLEGGMSVLPDNPHMLRELAGNYYLTCSELQRRQDCQEALRYMDLVHRLDPQFPLLLSHYGSMFFTSFQFMTEDEIDAFIAARLADNPADVIGNYLKGVWLFYKHWDYEGCIRQLEAVLKLQKLASMEPRVYAYLALSNFYLGRQKEAESLANKSIEVGQDRDGDSYYIRSIILRKDNLPQAVSDIEKYLELSKGPGKVKLDRKQRWLKQELADLKAGKVSKWWRSMPRGEEPWNEPEPGAPDSGGK